MYHSRMWILGEVVLYEIVRIRSVQDRELLYRKIGIEASIAVPPELATW